MNGSEYAVFGSMVFCAFALVLALVLALVVLGATIRWVDRRDTAKLMRGFAEQFPRRCFLCSYYQFIPMCKPPDHKCKDWTAEQ